MPRSHLLLGRIAGLVAVVATAVAASAPSDIFTAANFTGVAAARRGSADNVLYAEGFGTLDFRRSIPMPTDAHFPVASNTKVYVAISLYQLQERGMVNLSANVQDYLGPEDYAAWGYPGMTSWCPVVQGDATKTCRNFTFVQLLDMQACMPDTDFQFFPYPGTLGLVFGRYALLPLACAPGTTYYYSNPAFMLGAYFVEKFTNMTWRAYLDANVHGPLGQTQTYFDPSNGKYSYDAKRVDEWYDILEVGTKASLSRGRCTSEYDLGSASGAGGIVSSQYDEALLYFALFNFSAGATGAPLFTQRQSLIDLVTPRTLVGGYAFNQTWHVYYAQGLFVATDDATVAIPREIDYEGEIMCSHTSNRFRVAKLDPTGTTVIEPAMMTQAWTAVPVRFTTATALAAAEASGTKNFFTFFGSWQPREWLGKLSFDLLAYYMPSA